MSGLMSPPGNQNLWSVLNAKRKLSAEPLAHDPTATWARLKCRSAAVSCCTKVCYPFGRTQGGIGSEAARVRHADRWCGGGVATRGARAAVGKGPDYRLPRGGLASTQFSWFAASIVDCVKLAGSMDAPSRSCLVGRKDGRALRRDRSRIRCIDGQRHCYGRRSSSGIDAGDIDYPDRIFIGERPGCQRIREKFGAARGQRHRPLRPIDGPYWKAPGALREIMPALRRLAIIGDSSNRSVRLEVDEVQRTASTLGFEITVFEIERAEDIAPTFEKLKGKTEALYLTTTPLLTTNRNQLNVLALGARLPTMYGNRDAVEVGGLMSYGPDIPDLWRRSADYVDNISTRYETGRYPGRTTDKIQLAVNLTTAKTLGLEVPPGAARPRRRGD